jgi:hypothetical protein
MDDQASCSPAERRQDFFQWMALIRLQHRMAHQCGFTPLGDYQEQPPDAGWN